jgi:hypothetical protein
MTEISEKAKYAIKNGTIKIRVKRSGMFQQLSFNVHKVSVGDIAYLELFTERVVDSSEISRVAEELGMPIAAANGKAMPKGKTASDFQEIEV